MKNSESKSSLKKILLPALGGCVLSYLLAKIFDPLLEFLYSKFLEIGTLFIASFSDSIYKKISNGFSEQPSILLLYSLVYIFILLWFVAYTSSLHRSDSTRRDFINMKELNLTTIKRCQEILNMQQKESADHSGDDNCKTTPSELLQECQQLDKTLSDLIKEHDKDRKYCFIVGCIFYLIFSFYLISSYAQHSFINSIVTKTTNNIEIVSPYITDSDYKQLKSTFHSIESKEDYDVLTEKLQHIADENSIKLKE